MKMVQTSIIACLAFFLSAGVSFGAEMGDLDLTIRVIESDDLTEMHNELSLPASVADDARDHAEGEQGRGLNQANDVRDQDATEHEARDEREDEIENHDDVHEDKHDLNEERDEANEQENHEKEHDENSSTPDTLGSGG